MEFDPDLLVQPGGTRRDTTISSGSGRAASIRSAQSWMTEDTRATSVVLAPLQQKPLSQDTNEFDPLVEEDQEDGSYDLVAPPDEINSRPRVSLEKRCQQLFSTEHLQAIFADPVLFRRFAKFISTHRPSSVPVLIYYLDAMKALKAIAYANNLASSLDTIAKLEFTKSAPEAVVHEVLKDKAAKAFESLVQEDLPPYIAHIYINIVSPSISRRISGTLAPHLQLASEGLAEVFCLTDPSREDNPIVFASEEFNRTTQYGLEYIIGKNCRFLQGPQTNVPGVRRIKAAIKAGREHSEVLLNYRRDGSPFFNLLLTAPLTDSRGRLRYFIGAQVDVSGLLAEGTELDALGKLIEAENEESNPSSAIQPQPNDFESLVELFNHTELRTISTHGGRIYRDPPPAPIPEASTDPKTPNDPDSSVRDFDPRTAAGVSQKPRLLIRESSSSEDDTAPNIARANLSSNGRLSGIYTHYLLVRPYPSLRILFTSPSLRVPGILQSPLMSRIGGSNRVREDLTAALAEGRGVTAKIRWISRFDSEGRPRWVHFTPLIGAGGGIGVWMVVLVDAEEKDKEKPSKRAPVVDITGYGRSPNRSRQSLRHMDLVREDREGSDASGSRAGSPFSAKIV